MPFNLGEILEEPGAELDNAHFLLPPEVRALPLPEDNDLLEAAGACVYISVWS